MWRSRLMHNVTSQGLLGFSSRKCLHQAAFAAGSVILVNDALFSGLIQAADGLEHGGLVRSARFNGGAGGTYGGTGRTTKCAIAQAAGFVLAITLDLGLDISQSTSSKKTILVQRGKIVLDGLRFVQTEFRVLAWQRPLAWVIAGWTASRE